MITLHEDRQRILYLTTMVGLTESEQEHLWHLALEVGWREAKWYADQAEARGCTYRYTKDQVDAILGIRQPLWKRVLKDLFS